MSAGTRFGVAENSSCLLPPAHLRPLLVPRRCKRLDALAVDAVRGLDVLLQAGGGQPGQVEGTRAGGGSGRQWLVEVQPSQLARWRVALGTAGSSIKSYWTGHTHSLTSIDAPIPHLPTLTSSSMESASEALQ